MILIYTRVRYKDFKKMYQNVEYRLTQELAEQKNSTNHAISSTYTRLRSIENLIEISKKIIYEKDIKTLIDNFAETGTQRIIWDGKDKFGRAVANGMYYYRLKTKFGINTKKMILTK